MHVARRKVHELPTRSRVRQQNCFHRFGSSLSTGKSLCGTTRPNKQQPAQHDGVDAQRVRGRELGLIGHRALGVRQPNRGMSGNQSAKCPLSQSARNDQLVAFARFC